MTHDSYVVNWFKGLDAVFQVFTQERFERSVRCIALIIQCIYVYTMSALEAGIALSLYRTIVFLVI